MHAGAVELRKELSTLTALELPATLVFDYPSVAEMTAALAAMLPAAGVTTATLHQGQAAQAQAAQRFNGQPKRAAATPIETLASHWLPQVGSPLLAQNPPKFACRPGIRTTEAFQALS